MSGKEKLDCTANMVVYLATESLYLKPLKRKLINLGYNSKDFELWSDQKLLSQGESTNIVVLQADLWSGLKSRLDRSTSKIFIGLPSYFHNWESVKSEKASAFITPYDPPEIISDSIEQISTGHHYLSNVMKQFLSRGSKIMQEELLGIRLESHLTQSELEILVSIGEGFTTGQIADRRIRSIHTIKTQRKMVRRKLFLKRTVRLGNFAGREIDVLKTLLFIKKYDKKLRKICQNTT